MAGLLALYYSRKVCISKKYCHLFFFDPICAAMAPNTPSEPSGSWDSIHVFEAAERGRQAHYKLTSTIMLQLVTRKSESETTEAQEKKQYAGSTGTGSWKGEGWKKEGEVSLSGSMTRQVRFVSERCRQGSEKPI